MIKSITYLNTNRANETLDFYEKHFGATIKSKIMGNDPMFENSNEEFQMPEELAKDFVMNAEFEMLGQTFMLSDSWEKKEVNNEGVMICFTFDGNNEDEVSQIKEFYESAIESGCQITMPLGKTEWSDMYAMFIDPFGISWMISAY